MKKTFQKTLIAVATGAALMSAVGTASANSLLFPYFTTATGAQSVLTLANVGASVAPATQTLHYVYNYGSACTHYDGLGSLTANDIVSHSIAAPTAAAGGFGLAGADKSTPFYFPLANQTGFLVVSTQSNASTDALRGSMAIADPTSGLVVSYAGIDNALATNVNEGNFSAITDLSFPLVSLPSALVTTSWYGVVVGDMSADIAAGRAWNPGVAFSNTGTGVWDNDEVLRSGVSTKTITCSGAIVATDLMTSAQVAAVNGVGSLIKVTGIAVAPTAPSTGTATGAVLLKLQAVQAAVGAPFAGKQFLHRELAGL